VDEPDGASIAIALILAFLFFTIIFSLVWAT
jgi:hypothetical protein